MSVSIPPMLNVSEEDEIVQVCATLTAIQKIERDIIITFATSNGEGGYVISSFVYQSSNF